MKTVLVTGASRGIGRAISIEFAKKGYNVVINYVFNDKAAETLKSFIVENYDVDVMLWKCDVSNEDDVKIMVEEVVNHFGNIDVLVNNAGVAIDTTFEDKTKENFSKILNVNLIGPFLVSKEVSKYMLEKKAGSIVNVASTNGIDTYYPCALDYDASKAGLISLTHNLSLELLPYIRVNAVAPGWTNTDQLKEMDKELIKSEEERIYLKRFAEPEEIAKAVYFLASDDASYINNEILRVDGGGNHA